MPRNSASPPRRGSRGDRRSGGDHDRRDSRRDRSARDYRDSRAHGPSEDRGNSRRAPYDDDRRMGYDEREREKERRRDRDRYDTQAESSRRERRSASPSRRHGSKSPSASAEETKDKSKPNFKPSGLLAAETNTVKASDGTATVLKYNEPPEARKPVVGWRLYVFKGQEQLGVSFCHVCLCSKLNWHQNLSTSTVRAHTSLAETASLPTSSWITLPVQSNTQLFSVSSLCLRAKM
jgi:smad nuclear-interacting protein 1